MLVQITLVGNSYELLDKIHNLKRLQGLENNKNMIVIKFNFNILE